MNNGAGGASSSNTSLTSIGSLTSQQEVVNWSVYSCAQNLPAILNDPKRGKQVK